MAGTFSVSEALTISWQRSLSYRNQFSDLLSKSMDCFLYDRDLCHESVNNICLRFYRVMSKTMQKQPPQGFHEKSILKNFAKFARKYLCQSLCFNKVTGLRPSTLLKKRLWHRCFPVSFAKFLKTTIFYRTPLVAAAIVWKTLCYAAPYGWLS